MPPPAYPGFTGPVSSIGIDDGPFPPKAPGKTRCAPLVAAWLQGPHLYRVRTGWIVVDGLDATRQAEKLLEGSPRGPVLLAGVTFGGFNLVDPGAVHSRFRMPTIVVIGSRPDNRAVKRALVKHFPDWRERWSIIRSLGPLRRLRTMRDEPPIFYEAFGCSVREARALLRGQALVSRLPEPLRVAGIVARGLFSETSRLA